MSPSPLPYTAMGCTIVQSLLHVTLVPVEVRVLSVAGRAVLVIPMLLLDGHSADWMVEFPEKPLAGEFIQWLDDLGH